MIRAAVAGVAFLAFLTSACGSEESQPAEPAVSVASPSSTADEPTSTATPQNIMDLPDFAPLEPGTYFIDPDGDPSTPVRVVYEVPVEGWSQWIGALRSSKETEGQVGVSIITATNLVRDGCRDHRPADPPVGPSIDDLAAALADLAPFKVTSPPRHVTIYGYRGKHLELTVPDLPHEGKGSENGFTECVDGNLQSWIDATTGAFYGYSGPGYTEEFWILDVEGSRLVITAGQTRGSPAKDIAEMRAILDSIRIES